MKQNRSGSMASVSDDTIDGFIKHLLIKGVYRVWCRPNNIPGDFNITSKPSESTCANCLTAWRTATTGRRTRFRVAHTARGARDYANEGQVFK